MYSMIIDSESCVNIVSIILKKLYLNIVKHDRSYKLQWLNECDGVMVTKQIFISFLLEKYRDEVLCEVVHMHASYLLFGRPWQFDRKSKDDGFKNKYFLKKDGMAYTLTSLSPRHVYEDQLKLKLKLKKEK